jgi:hypothetical protein
MTDRRPEIMVWGLCLLSVAACPPMLSGLVLAWRPAYDSSILANVQFTCALAALAQTIVAMWLAHNARSETPAAETPVSPRRMVGWLLALVIGGYGVLAGLYRAPAAITTLFFVWSLLLLLALRPPSLQRRVAA